MEITVFAVVFTVGVIGGVLQHKNDWVIGLFISSFVFQAASAINIGETSIDSMLFACSFIVLISAIRYKKIVIKKEDFAAILLFVVALGSLIIPAVIYRNVEVLRVSNLYEKSISYEKLEIGIDNIKLLFTLFLLVLALIALNSFKNVVYEDLSDRILDFLVVIVLFFGIWQWLDTMGIIPTTVLRQLLYNNTPHWTSIAYGKNISSYNIRIFSTFSEPSYCGVFLAASFWALVHKHKTKLERYLLVFVLIELAINLSGSGVAAFVVGGIFTLAASSQITFNRKIAILGFGFLILAFAFFSGYLGVFVEFYQEKMRSNSYFERTIMNQSALEVFFRSNYMGLGFGSVRASGLLQNILGQMGILGVIVYFYFWSNFARRARRKTWLLPFMISVLGAQIVSCADLTLSSFWIGIFLVKIASMETVK